jgi:hypothetical protein
MVAWFQNPEYAALYELAQKMGAPDFQSSTELLDWLNQNFDRIKSHAFQNRVFFLTVPYEGDHTVIRYLWSVGRTKRQSVLTAVSRQINQISSALRKYLRLNPNSLHPTVSAA